jgi:hypothetical protein
MAPSVKCGQGPYLVTAQTTGRNKVLPAFLCALVHYNLCGAHVQHSLCEKGYYIALLTCLSHVGKNGIKDM